MAVSFTYLLALSFLFHTFPASASPIETPSQIYLKSGRSVSFVISAVHPWGMIDNKGEAVQFKVIDSLSTSDSSLADTIIRMHNGVTITRTPEGFVLNFANYVAPVRPPQPPEPLTPHSLALLYRYDLLSRFSVQYDGRVFASQNLIHRFQSSVGFAQDRSVYSSLNFAMGIGYENESGRLGFSSVASYGLYGGFPSEGNRPEMSSVLFVSFGLSYRMERSFNSFLACGLDMFLYRDRADLPAEPVIAFLGIGIEFR